MNDSKQLPAPSLPASEADGPSKTVVKISPLSFDAKKSYEENLHDLKVFLEAKDSGMAEILFKYLPNITEEEVTSDDTRTRFNAAVLKNLDKILADEDKPANATESQ